MLYLNIIGNILLRITLLAEPVLFGKVIDLISNQKTIKLTILVELLPLLIT